MFLRPLSAGVARAIAGLLAVVAAQAIAASPVNVTTYHYDNLRTGWNAAETVLNPASVASANFKPLTFVALDDQVDTQPLLISGLDLGARGTRDVLYVTTESNSVYALDAGSGQVLLKVNLGTPVPQSALPGGCGNNGPNVGIDGTPVIDPAARLMYVIAYTFENQTPVYRLHALDLVTLTDRMAPVVVGAVGSLADGTSYAFRADSSRQRPALLLANGTVYAGFGSFCDINANLSRGWVLGWNAATLEPLAANRLNDQRPKSLDAFFLSSVWMSGYGLAADASGNVFFVTGNTDYSGTAYNSVTNIAESAVEVSADLSTVKSLFTPTGPTYGHKALDQQDNDFGSGGLMLLPPQPSASTPLAAAVGKVGVLYLLNASNLGNGSPRPTGAPLAAVAAGGCWCGPAYYTAGDGYGRIVVGGGAKVRVFKVDGAASPPITQLAQSASLTTGQSPGFLTAVSSNGTTAGSAVIWAVSRPVDNSPANVSLYAFDENGNTLYSGVAGTWPNTGGNSNIMPMVANGRAYVASNQTLAIFGLSSGPAARLPAGAAAAPPVRLAPGEHEVTGIVRQIRGHRFVLEARDGRQISVDANAAYARFQVAEPAVGHGALVRGRYVDGGHLQASVVLHAKDQSALWRADR